MTIRQRLGMVGAIGCALAGTPALSQASSTAQDLDAAQKHIGALPQAMRKQSEESTREAAQRPKEYLWAGIPGMGSMGSPGPNEPSYMGGMSGMGGMGRMGVGSSEPIEPPYMGGMSGMGGMFGYFKITPGGAIYLYPFTGMSGMGGMGGMSGSSGSSGPNETFPTSGNNRDPSATVSPVR